ncbi:MAG: extracellular solute-binding protein [Spirochaetales bacterium]|nr:extracellular solute-binding protein [Spirochaetales bacterium]
MKKIALFLLLVFCASVLFAGGNKETAAGNDIGLSAPGVEPLVPEKITLTAFIPSIGFIEDIRENAMYKWIEEQTNVHIEWIESSKVDANTKLSVLLASGEYPDIIFGASGNGLAVQDVYKYGSQGIFIPLNDLIEKQGFYIKELFKAEPAFKDVITSPDGNIYALPAIFTDDYHMTMRQKYWINKKWLDNLGLKMPTTTDEFYAVLKAFKEKDANGNGDPNDEIPMTGSKRQKENTALWIMNAFIPAGGNDNSGDETLSTYEFVTDKGEILFTANKPEFREGLRFIRKLYKEGLMDVAALTQDRSQIKPLVDGGDTSRIGGSASHHPANFMSMSDDPSAPFYEYVTLPPLKGPKGQQNTPWFIDAVIKPGEFAITDTCKYPALAFRWADFCYKLSTMEHDKGIEGVHWERVTDPKVLGLNGKPAKYKYLTDIKPDDNAQINMGPGWTRDMKNEFAKSDGFSYEYFLYNATKQYEPFKIRRFPYSTAAVSAEDNVEFDDLRRTIHTFILESTSRFIIGDLDIEKDWDKYVSELEQIGLSRYLEILKKSL